MLNIKRTLDEKFCTELHLPSIKTKLKTSAPTVMGHWVWWRGSLFRLCVWSRYGVVLLRSGWPHVPAAPKWHCRTCWHLLKRASGCRHQGGMWPGPVSKPRSVEWTKMMPSCSPCAVGELWPCLSPRYQAPWPSFFCQTTVSSASDAGWLRLWLVWVCSGLQWGGACPVVGLTPYPAWVRLGRPLWSNAG